MINEQTVRFKQWAKISYFYFILVALLGLLLRFVFVQSVPGVNFKYFLHAHSHVAFLGWIFNALYTAIISDFIPKDKQLQKKYRILFILLQVSVLGMLFTFPLKGYYRDSIIFSTLHIVLSYLFAWYVFKDGKTHNRNNLAFRSIQVGLIFMVISSLGPFALGPMMAMEMSGSYWYHLAIYYYLHFQYNGWFVFAFLGLFIKLLDDQGIVYDRKKTKLFIWLMAASCVPAYALSTLWIPPPVGINIIGFAAAILQLIALALFAVIVIRAFPQLLLKIKRVGISLMLMALLFFAFKNIIQFVSAFEDVALLAFQVRNFIIAYLHMVFIGFCSLFLLGWFVYKKWLILHTKLQITALVIFIASFLLIEILTVIYPTFIMLNLGLIPNYVKLIFIISIGMPLGLILMIIPQKNKKKELFA